ncbi:uncharacterized protein PV09_04314 [Verruconis gallopava]|uniref:Serine carboxypeptidase S28 n=1 Tax=Verruconis gallopava TaxID=253628 RepID=A0A0D2ACG8_9PEZI|nr:uncharacterized protein PV09_04314 [Verruconis gallopava]KIW04563.1 hypothetical protein PV09_04314 [Verruconis gallopava]
MTTRIFQVAALASSWLATSWAYSALDRPNVINKMMRPPISEDAKNVVSSHATFSQLIDHANPDAGTFEQFYYYGTQYWKGPGSPVVLMTPGEVNATGYDVFLYNNYTTGKIAEEIGAAVVIVEHRYWGTSTPCTNLSTSCLQHLTLNNSIADLVRFAKEVNLPFDSDGVSNADSVPWIMVGGSYPGALAAWTATLAEGTFWAYWASSGPVNAMNYWEYFVPVQEGMPKNCSKDISLVIDHIDAIGRDGTEEQQKNLQKMFGLEDLEHYDDFASSLENGPWLWQGNTMYRNTGFFDFCDAVEGVNRNVSQAAGINVTSTAVPGEEGVGLQKALEGYAAWMKYEMIPGFCASYGYEEWSAENSVGCFDTYNASSPYYRDWSLSNTFDRQWVWMTCNEPFGYWQDGAPADRPSIVSRLVDEKYWVRQCGLFFPPEDGAEYGLAAGRTYGDVNALTGGWDIKDTTRLLFVNGQYDPWRDAGVSSDFRPGGPLASTTELPVLVVPGGFHCTDLSLKNGEYNAGVQAIIDAGIKQIVDWTGEYYESGYGNGSIRDRRKSK